ncbi:MAG: hypothetical protein NVS4B3_18140 [Gemmatimonadaceae bacterium]
MTDSTGEIPDELPPARTERREQTRRLAGVEDAKRIAQLAEELQGNALELQSQSQKLRDTLEALDATNEELYLTTQKSAGAQALADGATARLARLQNITAALSNTLTQDGVADAVLREAVVALECDAGTVVVVPDSGDGLVLLDGHGPLDPVMRSFEGRVAESHGPFAEVVERRSAIYLESFEEMIARYPAFRDVPRADSRNAWIFLPLEIGGEAVGALAFGFDRARRFGIVDRVFADTVARYCAQALDRVGLRIAAAGALTEAGDARRMAEHANEAKTQFLRAMSHELRTPLNAVTGYAELMELGLHGPVTPEQTVALGKIRKASAYLLRLVNDVLTVARLEGATVAVNLSPVRLDLLLLEVEGLASFQAKAKAITLRIPARDRAVLVAADPERLQQILLNLLTNAIKFTARGGTVAVSYDSDGVVVRLRVADTGRGILSADIERVFEPFVQIDRHLTSEPQQGVGLGLSISRQLARAMQGELTIESSSASGTIFTLELPVARSGDLAMTPTVAGDAGAPSPGTLV